MSRPETRRSGKIVEVLLTFSAIVLVRPAAAGADVNAGLIGHWTLDETSGTRAADASGHGYDMKLKRAQAWEAGKVKGGLRFKWGDEAVYVNPKMPFVPPGSKFTMSAWVKNDAQVKDIQRYLSLVYYVPGQPEVEMAVLRHKDGNLGCYLGNKGFHHLKAPAEFKVGQWYHVAMTWDGSTQRIYADGVELAHVAEGSFGSGTGLVLGSDMAGALDDVRIYARALTAAEIKDLWAATSGRNNPAR